MDTTTEKQTHSPGPWSIDKSPQTGWNIRDAGGNVPCVARVYREEDAHAIAALPDLLAALLSMVREFGQLGPKLNIREDFSKINALECAKRTIARAEGRP